MRENEERGWISSSQNLEMACEEGKKYKEVTRYGGEECGLIMEWVWGCLCHKIW